MSTTEPQAPVTPPDLLTLLDMKVRDALSSTRCHMVGTILSFNAVRQTATVSMALKSLVAGEIKTYPLLVDVPVFVLGGGDRCFTFPVRSGDTCLVCFNDRDFDSWFATGGVTVPNSPRLHDLSDGLALVGFRSLANPVVDYSSTDVEIRNNLSKIAVGEQLLLKNSITDLLTVLQLGVAALTSLNGVKAGGDASAAIAAFQVQLNLLLKSV